MFDGIKFTGTVNLGAVISSLVTLIGVLSVYFRVKAALAERDLKNGKAIEAAVKKRLKFTRPGKKPVVQPPPDNVDKS